MANYDKDVNGNNPFTATLSSGYHDLSTPNGCGHATLSTRYARRAQVIAPIKLPCAVELARPDIGAVNLLSNQFLSYQVFGSNQRPVPLIGQLDSQ